MCQQCRALQIELAKQQLENARLRRKLAGVRATAQGVAGQARAKMDKGGLPRGTWSYLRGARAVAEQLGRLA